MMSKGLKLLWQRWRSIGKSIALFLVCVVLVIGCNSNRASRINPSSTPSASKQGDWTTSRLRDRVTIGTTLKPRTLDPADSYEIAALNVIYNVGESLYTYEFGTTKLKPLLAQAMPKINKDGLTYTIPLRSGVTFQDGTPFNAKAMEFSLKRFISNGGKPSFLLTDIVDKIEAKGDRELSIKLKKPFAAFTSLLAFPGTCAVSPKAYKIGAGQFNPNQIVSTGAYKLSKFTSDSISLDVNDKYWGEKPANKGIDIQIYASNSANLYNGFKTGAIDVAYQSLDTEQIKKLQQDSASGKWQVIEAPGTVVNYMVLNLDREPLNKPEIRQAIASLIDRSLINKRVFEGQTEPIYSLIPTTFDVYQPSFEKVYGEANFAKANELLAKAGYSATNPATIEVWHPSGSLTRGFVVETLKALAEKELGGALVFIPKNEESASFFSNVGKGIYQAALADWYPDFLDPDNYIQPFMACNQGSREKGCQQGFSQSRGSFYFSDRANQLIDKQRQEQNPANRKTIFAQLQQTLAEDVPYIPLWQTKDYAFAQAEVSGVTINPSQNFPFWTIKRGK
jgi:peptide/nickel transport system substrate-binding protein